MKIIRSFTTPGDYQDLKISGTNRNDQVGTMIAVPDGETITFKTLDISDVFVPLIKKGNGHLHIREAILSKFGGDGMNFLGSNVTIDKTYVRDNTPTRTYDMHELLPGESVQDALKRLRIKVYDHRLLKPVKYRGKWVLPSYHVDGVFQAYAVDSTGYRIDHAGCIENIRLPYIEADLKGEKTQGIMCSEANRYSGFEIGTNGLFMKAGGYRFSAVFNQLDHSQIGSAKSTNIDGQIKIRDVKGSTFRSTGNTVEGLRESQLIMPKGSCTWGHYNKGQERFSEEELRYMMQLDD